MTPEVSVIIPTFNRRAMVLEAIDSVLAQSVREFELIVIDDGSTDGTPRVCEELKRVPKVHIVHMPGNRGKCEALKVGFAMSTGEIVIVQDADLEYDPNDWSRMLPLIIERNVADVVYGSRFYGAPHRSLYFHHYLGNRLISFVFNLLYDQMLSDIEVCYKMFTSDVLKTLHLTANGFGVEIEISAQIARERRWRIDEVGISYYGRTYDQGKKINWVDGLKALVASF